MNQFLTSSEFIDFEHPLVRQKAAELANSANTEHDVIRNAFYFVRDQIKHSSDFKLNPVTCKASDVLIHGTGYCYAKSHLLAALLRANRVPAGLCYQRLSVSDADVPPYCLHGLNAVYLKEHGWYRIDYKGFPICQAIADPGSRSEPTYTVPNTTPTQIRRAKGVTTRCGLARLQTVMSAAIQMPQTLMQDARGRPIR
jgi:hypothetical protein